MTVGLGRWVRGEYAPIWLATLVLFAISPILASGSLSSASLESTLAFGGVLAVAAVGQTLIVQQRGMDLSVAGNITLCALVLPIFITRSGGPLILGLFAVAVTAVLIGLANGLLVTRLGITPLIATLAMNAVLVGASLSYSRGVPSAKAPAAMIDFASKTAFGVPLIFLFAVVLAILVAFGLGRSVVGRRFVAVGANRATSRASGVPVERYIVGAYIAGSLCFAAAAVLLVGNLGNATITIGNEYLFPTIAAVVIGGTAFTGGRGSVVASAVAGLFLAQLQTLLFTMGAPSSSQYLAQAVAIAAAAAARSLTRREASA